MGEHLTVAQMALFAKYEKFAVNGATEFNNRFVGEKCLVVCLYLNCLSLTRTIIVLLCFTSVTRAARLIVKYYVADWEFPSALAPLVSLLRVHVR